MAGRGMGIATRGGGLIGKTAKPKIKKYAEGGLAGIADSAESLMDEVGSMADTISYGKTGAPTGGSMESPNVSAIAGFKKGGFVKSTASKRGDGCAKRGKTKGRMV